MFLSIFSDLLIARLNQLKKISGPSSQISKMLDPVKIYELPLPDWYIFINYSHRVNVPDLKLYRQCCYKIFQCSWLAVTCIDIFSEITLKNKIKMRG